MRDSYFTTPIVAILKALRESEHQSNARIDESLHRIAKQIEALLSDDRSPERQWRQQVAVPLFLLVELFQSIGNPVPSVEELATEMAY